MLQVFFISYFTFYSGFIEFIFLKPAVENGLKVHEMFYAFLNVINEHSKSLLLDFTVENGFTFSSCAPFSPGRAEEQSARRIFFDQTILSQFPDQALTILSQLPDQAFANLAMGCFSWQGSGDVSLLHSVTDDLFYCARLIVYLDRLFCDVFETANHR